MDRTKVAVIITLALAFTASDITAFLLYIYIGRRKHVLGWLWLTWLAVSLAASCGLVVYGIVKGYRMSKGGDSDDHGGGGGGGGGTELHVLPSLHIGGAHTFPSVGLFLTVTEVRRDAAATPNLAGSGGNGADLERSFDIDDLVVGHVLTPISPAENHASPLHSSPFFNQPPPAFPSAAKLREQYRSPATSTDSVFGEGLEGVEVYEGT